MLVGRHSIHGIDKLLVVSLHMLFKEVNVVTRGMINNMLSCLQGLIARSVKFVLIFPCPNLLEFVLLFFITCFRICTSFFYNLFVGTNISSICEVCFNFSLPKSVRICTSFFYNLSIILLTVRICTSFFYNLSIILLTI